MASPKISRFRKNLTFKNIDATIIAFVVDGRERTLQDLRTREKRVTKLENKKKNHFIFLLFYLAAYLTVFFCLEKIKVQPHILHTSLDDRIPFCEYFIIPYGLWFLFVGGSVCYFAFWSKNDLEYCRLLMTISMGLVVFFFTSVLYPNAQDMRPQVTGDGVFGWFVGFLYRIDTPTNILPSLHVFDAVACCLALVKHECEGGQRRLYVMKIMAVFLTILIILSTMFLKQHSVIDVGAALVLNVVCYFLLYHQSFGENIYCKIFGCQEKLTK